MDLNLRENMGISLTRASDKAIDTTGSVHELSKAMCRAGECSDAKAISDPTNRAHAGVGRPIKDVV